MGLFKRSPKAPSQSPAETEQIREKFRANAREWAKSAPTTYPDGSPFPAEQLLVDLADAATDISAAGLPDAYWQQTFVPAAMIRDAASSGPDLEVIAGMVDLRAALTSAGQPGAAEAVRAATAAVGRYWEQSGATDKFLDDFEA